MKIDDAHVLVTGASRGVGRAIVEEMSRRKARLTLVARNASLLEQVAAESGGHAVAADLSDLDAVDRIVDVAEDRHGPVDVLINNAAVMIQRPLPRFTTATLQASLFTNLVAPLELARRVVDGMVLRRQGSVVNISSLGGEVALPNVAPYSASKSGLTMATRVMQRELRGTGVRAQLVILGTVPTDMLDSAYETPVGAAIANRFNRLPTVEAPTVAIRVADAVESGRELLVMPGLAAPMHQLRFLPTRILHLLLTGTPRSL